MVAEAQNDRGPPDGTSGAVASVNEEEAASDKLGGNSTTFVASSSVNQIHTIDNSSVEKYSNIVADYKFPGATANGTMSGAGAADENSNSNNIIPSSPISMTATKGLAAVTPPSASPIFIAPQKKSAQDWKEDGNRYFSKKQMAEALEAYDKGLEVCGAETDAVAGFALYASLMSNRAMTLIKMEDYAAAEDCCTQLLNNQQYHHTPRLFKVWFRRAIAREGRVREAGTDRAQQVQILLSAKADLQASLKALEAETIPMADKERDGAKLNVAIGAQRIQKTLTQLQSANGNNKITHKHVKKDKKALAAASPTKLGLLESVPEDLPDPKSQRQDLVRLLLARQSGLQQQQGASGTVAAAHGEAFFLIDWEWWSDFCHYVDFFCWKQPSKQVQAIQAKLLASFPPGASVPESRKDDEEEERDEEEEDEEEMEPPGPIDNSSLFLLRLPNADEDEDEDAESNERTTQQIFYEQWYSGPQRQHLKEPTKVPAMSTAPALKPNLVRGYHFELIPREVYNALREWYGEVSPSICRRAVRSVTGQTTIPLYLLDDEEDMPQEFSTKQQQINYCGSCRAPHVSLRCKRCLAVYYCDRLCQENHWSFHKGECRVVKEDPVESGQASPVIVRKALPMSNGSVGLNNLGNTCFMNSALQCLSHAAPLTRHFLSSRFKQDLNFDNPLGTGGKLANAYEQVLKDLWMKVGARSISPSALKYAIALFAPRFAGCLQHDAQEFLAFLLDGLHEDLNRVQNAPYVEDPDVGENDDMAVAGARAWDAHRRRNDSLVMDSFYGQFRSTCVCPRCSRVSVTFDAFNHVSLEIPQQQSAIVPLTILVIRAATTKRPGSLPIRYAVHVRRNHPLSEAKAELTKLCGIPKSRLHLCECVDRNFSRMLHDDDPVSALQQQALLVAYEAESIENPQEECFHMVLRHKSVGQKKTQLVGEAEASSDDDFMGIPLLLSFPVKFSCRQVWEHLWIVVQDKVDEDYLDRFKDIVQFRLLDGSGEHGACFPVTDNNQQENTSDSERTPFIPRNSDEPLSKYLWESAINNFLLVYAEWRDLEPSEREPKGNEDEGSVSTTASGAVVDEHRFVTTESHPSWIDAMAKRREQAAFKGVSLDQCFEAFVKPERLDEENKWYCSNCKDHVRAMKTMELWRLPNILVVHLKRFKFKNVLRRDKLETLVNFPLDGLDMSAHCGRHGERKHNPGLVDETVPAEYDLFAVVNHFGRMGFGHYTAFSRSWDERGISPDWELFDDSTVRNVGSGTAGGRNAVVSPAAYVLFYRRRIWH